MALPTGVLPDVVAIIKSVGSAMNAVGGEKGLIATSAVLIGTFFIFQALVRAYQAASPHGGSGQHSSFGSFMSPLFFGMLLVNFWASQQSVADQIALSGSLLSPTLPNAFAEQVWSALQMMLHGFGTVMTLRGLLLAKSAGDGSAGGNQSPGWSAFWHILGGVILMRV